MKCCFMAVESVVVRVVDRDGDVGVGREMDFVVRGRGGILDKGI